MSSKTIDERVVEMRLNNSQFEKNASETLSTLDKLKQSLRFKDAGKGIEEVRATASRFHMNGMSSAIETVHAKFSALQVIGVTTLMNLTNSAVNAGKRIASALTIEPVKTGFQEYETQINAIQTILANTESKGSTLKDVNKALNELNKYADMTIYNFTEMTRNIGTFTAAGIDLDTSVSAIKGIANLAAVSGSTSQQASTAMYQLSQALASGTVKLMDWNSVVNAGMGGQVFQDALKETARVHGIAIDDMIKSEGSFRETLQKGWLTSEILTETLSKFTGDLNEKRLKSMGYSEAQIKSIMKMGKTANDAATKVKTFTQLYDTLKEAAQSGWTQSWEIIVGDFEEAKALLTEISDVVSDMINKSAESRNALLKGWKDLGGRTAMIESFGNAFEALGSVFKPISEAFRDIFPPMTAQRLFDITEGIKNFTESLKLSDETADKLKRTFAGLFSVVKLLGRVISAVIKPIFSSSTFGAAKGLLDIILTITAAIGDFLVTITNAKSVSDILSGISGGLSAIFGGIGKVIGVATANMETFGDVLSVIGDVTSKVFNKITSVVGDSLSWIADNISAGDIFAGLAGGGIYVVTKKFKNILDLISNPLEKLFGDKGKEKASIFKEVMSSIQDTLSSFASSIKITSLLTIATSILILSRAVDTISKVNTGDVIKSLTAMGVMFGMLTVSFRVMTSSISKFGSKGIVKTGISLMMMAKSIDILANAMTKISALNMEDVLKSLLSVGTGLSMFVMATKSLSKVKSSLTTGVAMLAIAESMKILSDSLSKLGKLSWDEVSRGLTAMGGALTELSGTLIILGKFGKGKISSAASVLVLVQSLDKICSAMVKIGKLSWDEVSRGLTAMGGALTELSGTLIILGKFGSNKLSSATSMVILVQSLDDMSSALTNLGRMSWEEIQNGLVAMGGALTELALTNGLLGKLAGGSSLAGAASIVITVQSLEKISNALFKLGMMTWDEIGRGLVAMGGALAEIAIVSGALGALTGFAGILGAAAIWVTIQGLGDLANAFEKFGSMSWDEIGRGFVAMGGALTEVAVVSGALGYLTGMAGVVGGAAIWVSVQGLDKLANALIKFGSMSWDEIGRGLVAMGGALTEVAVVSGALGYLTGMAGVMGGAAIWVSVQGLEKLANSFKKFGLMSWDEIGRGLSAMGAALGEVALGSLANTLGILGSFAIAEVAEPLGVLADSVKKWKDVVMPSTLKDDLYNLSSGVKSFNFSRIFGGVGGFREVAEPLGIMADSVKRWKDVVMPATIKDDLSNLASGVKSFNFASWFGSTGALAEISTPLGTLADSVKKWKDVVMPLTIKDDLSNLASGLKSFNFASWFGGTDSFSAIVTPLGTLAGSVSKWKDVTVPVTIEDDLSRIAGGIKSFRTFLGDGGAGSIATLAEPLGALSDSIRKWSDLKVPEGFGDELKKVADAVTNFSHNGIAYSTIAALAEPLAKLTESVLKWNNVKISEDIGARLMGMGLGIAQIKISTKEVDNLSDAADGISMISKSMQKLSEMNVSAIADSITKVLKSVKNVEIPETELMNIGQKILKNIIDGIKEDSKKVYEELSRVLSSSTEKVKSFETAFYRVGADLVKGFANGIDENTYLAEAKSIAMARAAAQAAKKELDEHSPSKIGYGIGDFFGIAFVNGIADNIKKAYNVSTKMASFAKSGLTNTISNISDVINSDMDLQPTIRPVVDTSGVIAGANRINGVLSDQTMRLAADAGSINTMMNRRIQNGSNSDVVAAINDLNKDLNNLEISSYNIGNVGYDNGSAVSDAVENLVRAIKMDRRS